MLQYIISSYNFKQLLKSGDNGGFSPLAKIIEDPPPFCPEDYNLSSVMAIHFNFSGDYFMIVSNVLPKLQNCRVKGLCYMVCNTV